MKKIILMILATVFLVAVQAVAGQEYRVVLMVSYPTAAQRDAATEAIKTKIQAPGNIIVDKASGAIRAEISKDEYVIPDPIVTGAELIKVGQN